MSHHPMTAFEAKKYQRKVEAALQVTSYLLFTPPAFVVRDPVALLCLACLGVFSLIAASTPLLSTRNTDSYTAKIERSTELETGTAGHVHHLPG